MIKAYIFDLDGTLVNSLQDLADSVNKGLVKANLSAQPLDNFKNFIGNGRDVLIQKAMGGAYDDTDLRDIVRSTFDTEYAMHSMDNTASYQGISEVLDELLKKGVKIGVLSNKPNEFVADILQKIFPDIKFTLAWGQQPKYKRKPSGEALTAMLELMQVDKSDCIYFGDSDVDVYTAQDADVRMCGVLWGFRTEQELKTAGADIIISTPKEILDL